MIPTQRVFPNQLPSPYVFPNSMLNMALNHTAPHLLRNAVPQMALNYQHNLPTFISPVFPKIPDALSMLKLQKDLLTQINSLYPFSLLKSESNIPYSLPQEKNFLSESPLKNIKQESKADPQTSIALPNDPEICFEAQIKYIIQFFVNSLGIATNQEINQTKQKYSHNPQLLQVFAALESKYAVTTKTREEMVKWVIRRCLKASKNSIKKGQKKDQKQALKDLCTRYFKDAGTDSNGEEEEEGSENDMVSRVLPFRKNSKNKTMNSQFVAEIFQSEEFRGDYREFLKNLDDIMDKENTEKLNKFSEFVVRCAKKHDFKSIAKYKRIPWLKVWLKNTKRIAEELDEGDYEGKMSKKVKST